MTKAGLDALPGRVLGRAPKLKTSIVPLRDTHLQIVIVTVDTWMLIRVAIRQTTVRTTDAANVRKGEEQVSLHCEQELILLTSLQGSHQR